ncbi:MAG: hypothetical protein AABY07_03055 [Nanoarchaeota archaeon]
MKRLLALGAAATLGLLAHSQIANTVPSSYVCKERVEDQTFYHKKDGKVARVDRFQKRNYDIDCDGKDDMVVYNTYNGISIYELKNKEGKVEYFYDPVRDWLNGNEVRCDDLADCMEKASRPNLEACMHEWKWNRFKLS